MKTPSSLLVFASLAFAACSTSPGGPEYAELGIRTLDATGQELDRVCFPLPVLPGGEVVVDRTLAPGLSAHVETLRDSAEVTLHGTDDPVAGHVTVPQAQLLMGYTRTLAVTTVDGDEYSVVLIAPCTPPQPAPNP